MPKLVDRMVVVGASLAGCNVARTLRQEGYAGQVLVIGQEPHRPYDRPPLSKDVLVGAKAATDVELPFASELDVVWLLGHEAKALDPRQSTVTIAGPDGAETVSYDGLAIATGVRPRTLPGFEPDSRRVHQLRTLEDAAALAAALTLGTRLLIIGSGFIGVEVASSARDRGVQVTIASLDPPLAVAGAHVSEGCARMLRERGVALHSGVSIVGHRPGGDRSGSVELSDGTEIDYDVVLVAVGSLPNVEWLADSGLDITDGVLCDATCAALSTDGTVVEGLVAAGDVARWPHPAHPGLNRRIEHWSNAVEQGVAAARRLLHGADAGPYAAVPSFWSDHCGVRLQAVGLPGMGDRVEMIEGGPEDSRFAVASYLGDRLVGGLAYGLPRAMVRLRGELHRDFEARSRREQEMAR